MFDIQTMDVKQMFWLAVGGGGVFICSEDKQLQREELFFLSFCPEKGTQEYKFIQENIIKHETFTMSTLFFMLLLWTS